MFADGSNVWLSSLFPPVKANLYKLAHFPPFFGTHPNQISTPPRPGVTAACDEGEFLS